jgi:DNA-directed RNA polymerase specialized sigma24 family protein
LSRQHAPRARRLRRTRRRRLYARLQLVAQIPERPRRFLLRLALGYSYDEIAAVEGVSRTTTNKQIARAKRICATSTMPQTPRGRTTRLPRLA